MDRRNNCNDVRLIAAVLVVLSHSFMLANGSNDYEPMFWLSHGQVTVGGISVITFFLLSGFLITSSFDLRSSVVDFAIARALRIVPALATMLLVTTFILGPCLTKLPVDDYLRDPALTRYLVKNLSLLTYVDNLPDVLSDNPFPGIVNGSLWTLHIEAACYALAVVIGVAGRRFTRLLSACLLVAGLLSNLLPVKVDYPILLITCFLAGASLYHWPMRRSRTVALACAGVLAATAFAGGFVVASATAGAYLVWYAAFAPPWRENGITGSSDLSYGTYIWAFPVEQTVVQCLGKGTTWYVVVMISLPITMVLAWLSWNLVEKHALKLKRWRRVQLA